MDKCVCVYARDDAVQSSNSKDKGWSLHPPYQEGCSLSPVGLQNVSGKK